MHVNLVDGVRPFLEVRAQASGEFVNTLELGAFDVIQLMTYEAGVLNGHSPQLHSSAPQKLARKLDQPPPRSQAETIQTRRCRHESPSRTSLTMIEGQTLSEICDVWSEHPLRAITEQVRTISRARIVGRAGRVDGSILHALRGWLRDFLDL